MPDLNYSISGEGRNVVLLHPIGLNRHLWGGFDRKAAQMFRVIAFDLPGHGQSGGVDAPVTIASYAGAIIKSLTDADIRQATFVGLSFGGMISQQIALARPDMVEALVLGACPALIAESSKSALVSRGQSALQLGMAAILNETLQRWFTNRFITSPVVEQVAANLLQLDPNEWAKGWLAISTHNALSQLGTVAVPALVVHGDLDQGASVDAAKELAAAIPNASLTILAGVPHMSQLEAPERFADVVMPWLRERLGYH